MESSLLLNRRCSGMNPCEHCSKRGIMCIYGPRKRIESVHKRMRVSSTKHGIARKEIGSNSRPDVKYPRNISVSKKKVPHRGIKDIYALGKAIAGPMSLDSVDQLCDDSLLTAQPASAWAPHSFQIGECRYLQDYLDSYNSAIPLLCIPVIVFLCSTGTEKEDIIIPPSAASQHTFSGVATVTPEVTSAENFNFALADLKPSVNSPMAEVVAEKNEQENEWSTSEATSEASHASQTKGKRGTNVSKNIIQLDKLATFFDISDASVAGTDAGAAKGDDCRKISRDDEDVLACDAKDASAVMTLLHCACAFISIFQFKDASIISRHVASARKCLAHAVHTATKNAGSPYLSRAYAALELVRLVNPVCAPAEANEINYVHMSEHHLKQLTRAQLEGEQGYTFFLLGLVTSWQEMSASGKQPFQSPLKAHGFQHTCCNIGQLMKLTEAKEHSQDTIQVSESETPLLDFPSKLSVAEHLRPPTLSIKLIESSSMQSYAPHKEQFSFSAVSHTIEQDDAVSVKCELEQEYPIKTRAMTEEEEQEALLQSALELRDRLGCAKTFVYYANYKLLYWHRRLKSTESICVSPRSPHFQSGVCYAGANTDATCQQNAYHEAATSKLHEILSPTHDCDYLCDYDEYQNDLALAQMLVQSDIHEQKKMYGASFDLMTDSCTEQFAYLFLRFSACMHRFYGVLAKEENAQKKDLHDIHKKHRKEQIKEVENDLFSLGHFIMKRPHLVCTPQSVYVSITVDQMLCNLVLLKVSARGDDIGRATRTSFASGRFISRELSHSLKASSIIEPMRKIAKNRYIYLPYNVILTKQLCPVLDLSGNMLELNPSDPAAIAPPESGPLTGAHDCFYSSNDYLLELSFLNSHQVRTSANAFVESEMTDQFQWNENDEKIGSSGNCAGVRIEHTFDRYEKTFGTSFPVSMHSHSVNRIDVGERPEPPNTLPSFWLPEPLAVPVKRKPGRPRKIRPLTVAEKEVMQIGDISEHLLSFL